LTYQYYRGILWLVLEVIVLDLKNRLKKLRREKSVSAGELADLTGKAESTIRTWETGKSFPDAETLSKLADFFNVSVDWLLGRSAYRNTEQAAEYEMQFIHSVYREQIEQIKKQLIDICRNHREDVNMSPVFIRWFMETFDECAELFERLLDEVKNGHNVGTINATYLEIMGAVNKLGLDISQNYPKKPKRKGGVSDGDNN
jgi:transcriptional regulator with XRE-family HTH domain